MNQEILLEQIGGQQELERIEQGWAASYFPTALALIGAVALTIARIEFGGTSFITDGALMMLALASYLIAAVFYLTNFYAPFRFAERLGLWAATLGVFFNLASWLIRWVAAYERELAIFQQQGRSVDEMPWLFRYVPFANLYDLSVAFAFGAGITTLLLMRRRHFRVVAALSLPLSAIILVLARFIGDELNDLPPVLDSYWRPIHVGIASLSYGIALVCFAVAVLYLIKDGLKVEKIAIWTSVFAIAVFATVGRFSVFAPATFGTYSASTFLGTSRSALALRADIPMVGWWIVLAGVLLAASIIAFAVYFNRSDGRARSIGHWLLRSSLVAQGAGIVTLVYQLRSITNVIPLIDSTQFPRFAIWMMQQQDVPQVEIDRIPAAQLTQMAAGWISENSSQLHLSLNANPVELSALITAFAGTLFAILFSIKTEKLKNALPSIGVLDGAMYKLGGIAFAGLALLLITGAIWANESWGRYWGWDAKEVGALVAWITYAGFLHSRIAYGWRGRRSAYFAIVAFLFVIFTYLGVSYLLPGLHSYA